MYGIFLIGKHIYENTWLVDDMGYPYGSWQEHHPNQTCHSLPLCPQKAWLILEILQENACLIVQHVYMIIWIYVYVV